MKLARMGEVDGDSRADNAIIAKISNSKSSVPDFSKMLQLVQSCMFDAKAMKLKKQMNEALEEAVDAVCEERCCFDGYDPEIMLSRRISTRRKGNPNPPEQVPIPQDVVENPQGIDVLKEREVENFGSDKDIKNLLKILQPSAFTGEGLDVLEEWIMSMEDYFDLAKYNTLAQGIMGRAKLKGPAKLWRKLSCKSRGIAENTQGWEDLKERLKECYLPLNYSTNKMNEFFSCTRNRRAVEEYYENFVKLSRHAFLMSEEQKLSKFILALEGTLADEVESLRPTSLADALIRAKSKLSSLLQGHFIGDRKRNTPYYLPVPYKPSKAPFVPTSKQAKALVFCPPAPMKPVQVKALPVTQSGKSIQCFECKEWGHKKYNCPKAKAPTRPPLPPQHKTFLNRNSGKQNRQVPAGNPRKATTVNYVSVKDEMEEQAQIYTALDPSGYNRQFSILEVQGDYEGRLSNGTGTNLGYEGKEVAPQNNPESFGTMEGIPH
ncbi:hypothetical protein L7F22_057523 [Adiantum nelumboides]|nr:hypothetical protein [Adiantum nelumboides]